MPLAKINGLEIISNLIAAANYAKFGILAAGLFWIYIV